MFVGLAFAVVGIGASMIYFFWNRWFENNLKPITDNNKTDELKIIQKSDLPRITVNLERKKEVEIKQNEKEKSVEQKEVLEKIEKEEGKAGNKDVNNPTQEHRIVAIV